MEALLHHTLSLTSLAGWVVMAAAGEPAALPEAASSLKVVQTAECSAPKPARPRPRPATVSWNSVATVKRKGTGPAVDPADLVRARLVPGSVAPTDDQPWKVRRALL